MKAARGALQGRGEAWPHSKKWMSLMHESVGQAMKRLNTVLKLTKAGANVNIDVTGGDDGSKTKRFFEKLTGTQDLGEYLSHELCVLDLDYEQCPGDFGKLNALKVEFKKKTFLFYIITWTVDDYFNDDWNKEPMMVKAFNTADVQRHTIESLYMDGAHFDERQSSLSNPDAQRVDWPGSLQNLAMKGLPEFEFFD